MAIQTTTIAKAHTVRLKPDGDLAKEVAALLDELGINYGLISIIGALGRATLGSYSFTDAKYNTFDIDHELEILHCTGNISLLEGKPFAHLHATVSGHDGKAIGGHVFEGCTIKVAECVVLEFDGAAPERVHDDVTGLKLWPVD